MLFPIIREVSVSEMPHFRLPLPSLYNRITIVYIIESVKMFGFWFCEQRLEELFVNMHLIQNEWVSNGCKHL